MASFNKFNSFVEAIAEKVHDLGGDTLKMVLTAAANAPVATNTQRSDLTEISAGNGYNSGGNTITTSTSSQTSGTYKLVCADLTITASGGSIGPFRYFTIANETATNDELVGWWDYGSEITLNNGESVTVDFSATNGVLQIA
jgi:hypothetical protein